MSQSISVIGFTMPDENYWRKMKAIYDACDAVGIAAPAEVRAYFSGEAPYPSGIRVELAGHPAVQSYSEEMQEGFEVDLTKLPKDLTAIRFVISY